VRFRAILAPAKIDNRHFAQYQHRMNTRDHSRTYRVFSGTTPVSLHEQKLKACFSERSVQMKSKLRHKNVHRCRRGDESCNCALPHDLAAPIRQTLDARLSALGFEESDRKELQADLRHLRVLRRRDEQVDGFVLKAIITSVLTGFVGALWLTLRTAIGR
jgi:hypothetical protein